MLKQAGMTAMPTWCCRLVVMHSLQKGPWQQREMTGSWAPSMQMGHSPESSPTSFSSSCTFFSADSPAQHSPLLRVHRTQMERTSSSCRLHCCGCHPLCMKRHCDWAVAAQQRLFGIGTCSASLTSQVDRGPDE